MSHETLENFEEDKNLIKEYKCWKLLIRNKTKTLGNCVLIIKRDVRKFSELNSDEFAEFATIVIEVEKALKSAFEYDKINWMMLMMVDPQVHFHIFPRYQEPRNFAGIEWVDTGWKSGMPEDVNFEVSQDVLDQIAVEIKTRLDALTNL